LGRNDKPKFYFIKGLKNVKGDFEKTVTLNAVTSNQGNGDINKVLLPSTGKNRCITKKCITQLLKSGK